MDLGATQRLVAMPDPQRLGGLMQRSSDPSVSKAVAQQFGALFMQGLLQQSDGAGLAMTDGVGNGVVNNMFATTMGQVAMSGEKLGLTDLMIHSLEAKQRAANGSATTTATPATTTSASSATTAGNMPAPAGGFPLTGYWQGNGIRPLGGGHMRVPAPVAPASGGRAITSASFSSFPITMPGKDGATAAINSGSKPSSLVDGLTAASRNATSQQVAQFTQQLAPLLQQAGAQLGVSPRILLAQAAIETGWGRAVVGNNIFGVKAGSSWSGDTVTTGTHEYEDGKYVAVNASFRAYPSLDAAVRDFTAVVGGNQRYRAAIGTGEDAEAYGRGLIAGGWATDIDYVHKLQSVAEGPSAMAAFAANTVPQTVATPAPR